MVYTKLGIGYWLLLVVIGYWKFVIGLLVCRRI
jgi:hypothetical protein